MGHVKKILCLLAITTIASADTYYEKTTIPPKIQAHSFVCNATGSTAAPTQCTSINSTPIGPTTPSTGVFSALTDAGITGSTQCLQVNSSGVLSGVGAACGTSTASAANPSGTIGLTAVNGSASSFMRSDGAAALSQSIVPTWSGLHTFSAGLTTTFVNQNGSTVKSGSTLLPAQFGFLQQISNSGSPTSISNAYVDLISITDNQDSSGSTDGGQSGGFRINYTFGASSARGKEAFATNLTGVANLDSGVTNRNYVGITSYVQPVANGGTLGATKGAWFGGNTNIKLDTGTLEYVKSLSGWEDDIANGDASTEAVIGHSIIFTASHTQRASIQNLGLNIAGSHSIASGNAGLDCAVCIGGYSSFWPMDPAGSVFTDWSNASAGGIGQNTGTVANLIYFPMLTITGYAISTPGFTVDGSGNLSANSIAGPGGTKSPYTLANSAIPFVLPGSATMGNNGALTAVAALSATVPNAYVFAYPGTIGNATAASVTITGTAGQFACTCTGLVVGQYLTLSGTYGGTGSITGYTDPTMYYVSATNGTSTFTLKTVGKSAIVTTAGTPTGITYAAGGGWYFAQGSSTTAYTVYNNLYVSGKPTIPASPTAFSTTGSGAYTASPLSINIQGPIYTLTGGSLGLDGGIDANMYFKYNNDANAKTVRFLVASMIVMTAGPTTSTAVALMGHMSNVGSASVQNGWQQQINSAAASSLVEQSAGAVNTGSDQSAFLDLKLVNAADVVELASYSIEVRPN